MDIRRKSLLLSCTLLALGSTAGQVSAAGFALIEQSVSGMGTAYAGGAALAEDNSTLFFNPAGMTRLKGTRGSAGIHLVLPSNKFNDNGSTYAGALGGASLGGGDGGDAGGLAGVPHTYISHQFSDKYWLGFAINAPFGLTTEYESDWIGRYHAIKSAIKTVNLNPSIAFKANKHISLSAGISAQYLDAELSNAIDFGAIDALPTGFGGLGGALGLGGPGASDGKVAIEADSWGWGFNLGALFEVSDNTRLGFHYRSEIDHSVEGTADFSGPSQALVSAAIFGATGLVQLADTPVKSDVTLPATASISFYHQLNPEIALMGDYTWTGWSSIPELRFNFASDQSDGITTFNWRNTYRVALGGTYRSQGSKWQYRAGAAYDQSPVKNSADRGARLPDNSRIWLALGAGYQFNKNTKIDIGYSHLFIKDPGIDKSATSAPGQEDFLRGNIQGTYESSVDILSIQAEMTFI